MGKIYQDITELIGHTPLMELSRLAEAQGAGAKILGKLESFNPAGSVKDRVAKKMIEDAEASGKLAPGSVIIEPTSGNTGIGLAAVGTARGYRVIIVMPDTMSAERRSLMKAYGAEVVLSEGSKGMTGALETAAQLAEETKGAVIMGQFVESVQSCGPLLHYGAGAVGGYRGQDRYPGGRNRNRRYNNRNRRVFKKQESCRLCGGGGSRWFRC